MTTPKTGALTIDDIAEIWRGSVDESYSKPLEEAGDGHGIEGWSQAWEVYARVSQAIDVTTQAMFILPWSGQTNPPAGDAEKATVTLTFRRTNHLEKPIRLAAGTIIIAHRFLDWGADGGVEAFSGLLYILSADLVFHPGEKGPFTVTAEAEKPGYSYNDPLPGTLDTLPQAGAGFNNDLASVSIVSPVGLLAPSVARATVQAAAQSDMFIPEHVGQQILFTSGSNARKMARIKAFYPPDPVNDLGSRVDIEIAQSVQGTTFAGTFIDGEEIVFTNGGPEVARGRVFGSRLDGAQKRVTYDVLRGTFTSIIAGTILTGQESGATMTVVSTLFPQLFVAETDTAEWRVLMWDLEMGLTVTNVAHPEGGVAGWLDELGAERNINRSPGESSTSYRKRVATPADVVTPNAIRRALNRTLGTISWCFREVGTPLFPGWFFDFDAFDYDMFTLPGTLSVGTFQPDERVVLEQYTPVGGPLLVKTLGYFGKLTAANTVFWFIRTQNEPPSPIVAATHRVRGLSSGAIFEVTGSPSIGAHVANNRFRALTDYASFRGYFLVGVPRLAIDEFGFAYDGGLVNAFDLNSAYDGFPAGVRVIYGRARQAVDDAHMGGVGFDMYLLDEACAAPAHVPGGG